MRRWPGLVIVLFALTLVGAACSKSNDQSNGGTTGGASTTGGETGGGQITINGDKANDHGSKDVSGMDEFELEADDFYFNPTTLQGTAGEKLKLEVKNEGSALHNFTLEDQNIDQDVAAGKDATVTVTFPASGVLEFFCKYHKSSGMVGQLQAS